MPWIRTPAGTLVPDEFLAEVQLLFNIAGAIEDCDLSDEERGLMEERLIGLEQDLDKEYVNECDDSWDDRTEVGVFGGDEHKVTMTGQMQTSDGLLGNGPDEVKTMDEDDMAGEQATQLDEEVELKAGEQTLLSDVVLKVDMLSEAGERTQVRDKWVMVAGEQTQGGVVWNSCSGSEEAAEVGVGSEDWIQDSVIIDISADASVWSSELDSGAVQKQIADADSGVSGTGAGSEDSAEVGVGFVKEKLIQFDDVTDERYWTGQTVRLESDCGIEGFAAWLDSLAGGGTEEAAEVVVGSEDWIRDSVMNSIGGCGCEFDADAVGKLIAIEMDAAGLDSLVTGSGSVVIPDVSFGFGSGFKEKMIEFDDVAETAREDEIGKKGSDDTVSGLGRDVVSEFVCSFDISGRFGSNVLYDPGGSAAGLSSWGLLVSSVFASVEAHNVDVVVLLRALWFYCEIMSFVALEALEAWTFEYSRYRN
jgi:hypothetical protein